MVAKYCASSANHCRYFTFSQSSVILYFLKTKSEDHHFFLMKKVVQSGDFDSNIFPIISAPVLLRYCPAHVSLQPKVALFKATIEFYQGGNT